MRMIVPHTTGRLLDELSTDINAFFESVLGEDHGDSKVAFVPKMDFVERDDAYELAIDLPGVNPDDVHVDVNEDHLSIHGSRHQVKAENDASKRRIERSFGDFRRSIRFPKAVDRDAIAASYEHGVLTVTLPKSAKSGSRRVAVSHGDAAPAANDSPAS